MNRPKKKLATAAAATALALTALGGVWLSGSASAAPQTATTAAAPAAEVTSPDTDTLQQGDQNTPDTTTATDKADAQGTGETPESGSASDGPGGHQDPAGDVQHEGGANEQ